MIHNRKTLFPLPLFSPLHYGLPRTWNVPVHFFLAVTPNRPVPYGFGASPKYMTYRASNFTFYHPPESIHEECGPQNTPLYFFPPDSFLNGYAHTCTGHSCQHCTLAPIHTHDIPRSNNLQHHHSTDVL